MANPDIEVSDFVFIDGERAVKAVKPDCSSKTSVSVGWNKSGSFDKNAIDTNSVGELFEGDGNGIVRRLDPADGSEIWRHREHGDESSVVEEVAADTSQVFSIGDPPKNLYAAETSSGTINWSQSLDNAYDTFIDIDESNVYAANDEIEVYAKSDGALQYKISPTFTPLRCAVDGSQIYVNEASNNEILHAYDKATQNQVWSITARDQIRGIKAYDDDVFIVTRGIDGATRLKGTDGTEKWRTSVTDTNEAGDANNNMFVIDADDKTTALNATTGSLLWQIDPTNSNFTARDSAIAPYSCVVYSCIDTNTFEVS